MTDMNKIFELTVKNIREKGLIPTPNVYTKEYCKSALELELTALECEKFKEFVSKLTKTDQQIIKKKKLETFEDVLCLLLQRVEQKSLQKISDLLNDSLKPSISLLIDDELNKFAIKIGNSPELIFEEEIQEEIKKFIEKRVELDKSELEKKAKEVTTIVSFLAKYLTEAISVNKNGSKVVSNITKEIETIEEITVENLNKIQSKLINAAKNIEQQMDKTTKKLESEHLKIKKLREKIKKLEEELSKARQETLLDSLTNIYNKRGFDKEFKRFEGLYLRNNLNYAVIFFDIDFFKKVNDTYGHEAGDKILSTFAKVLQKSLRDSDIVARYGGEEFVTLSPIENENDLKSMLSRIKKIVNEHKFRYKEHKIKITFSAGVAIRNNHNNMNETFSIADKLVYKAKSTGRNKVCFENGDEI